MPPPLRTGGTKREGKHEFPSGGVVVVEGVLCYWFGFLFVYFIIALGFLPSDVVPLSVPSLSEERLGGWFTK